MQASSASREFERVRRAVLLGLFGGTGVGLGFLLAGVPGVELMTANAALAGAALGAAGGATVGLVSAVVYSLASPFGPPMPLLLAAQGAGLALAGLGGALWRVVRPRSSRTGAVALAGAAGLMTAVVFDTATNVAAAVALGLPIWATLVAGSGVAALHAVTTTLAFGALLPGFAPRLERLRRPGPRVVPAVAAAVLLAGGLDDGAVAQGTVPVARDDRGPAVPDSLVAPADSLVATADSLAAVADTTGARPADSNAARSAATGGEVYVRGWQRPLWTPFSGTLREELERRSGWLVIADGGQGAAVFVFGEPGTSPAPAFERDGLPLGTGHRYLDDPEAIATVGHAVDAADYGLAAGGGLTGSIRLRPDDPVPDRDLADTRWFKGPHETYLRDLHVLTAAAPWRLGFDFQELLDNEGYDFRTAGEDRYEEFDDPFQTDFWGHAKFRSGRGLVRRDLGAAGSVAMSVETVRKLKKGLPAYDLEHQDLWTNRAALDWRSAAEAVPARLAVWWIDADADWDRDAGFARKEEGGRNGVLAEWGDPDVAGRARLTYGRWTLIDSGADPIWAAADTGEVRRQGEEASLRLARAWTLGPGRAALDLGAWWDEQGGWLLGGAVELAEPAARPRWQLRLEHGGRAPRSDELATAWRWVVPDGRQTVALPNGDLGREDEWRLAAAVAPRWAGFDLALSGAVRRLREGIGWRPADGGAETGRWENGLALDSATIRAAVARQGRCLGWLRVRAEGTWRTWEQHDLRRLALPPAFAWQVSALWEQHFFREDGILQLAGFFHGRGELDDPWSLAASAPLPATTTLDAIIGFRLVGTNLSLELLNLAGAGAQLSAGSVDHDLELRWRLNWVFHY